MIFNFLLINGWDSTTHFSDKGNSINFIFVFCLYPKKILMISWVPTTWCNTTNLLYFIFNGINFKFYLLKLVLLLVLIIVQVIIWITIWVFVFLFAPTGIGWPKNSALWTNTPRSLFLLLTSWTYFIVLIFSQSFILFPCFKLVT